MFPLGTHSPFLLGEKGQQRSQSGRWSKQKGTSTSIKYATQFASVLVRR